MRFRDPKTGDTLEIEEIRSQWENVCSSFFHDYPENAARMMRYEVIKEDAPADAFYLVEDSIDQEKSKPLSEWTLGEIKAECKKCMNCDNCLFDSICDTTADEWEIENSISPTASEIEICKALGAKWISKEQGWPDNVMLWETEPKKEMYNNEASYENRLGEPPMIADVRPDKFPSVKPGDCICVEEL